MEPYVLIVGYRREIAAALYRLGAQYSIWSEKRLLNIKPKGVDEILVAPIPRLQADLDLALNKFRLRRNPTHIIAGTESAVFPTAYIREFYGSRQCSPMVPLRCTDKVAMKNFLSGCGIPMTGFRDSSEGLSAGSLIEQLGLPLVIKDRRGSGSRNLVVAYSPGELEKALGPEQIYESFIDADEGSVESFIANGKIQFTNVTEYREKKVSHVLPGGYSSEEMDAVLSLNHRVIEALGIPWGMTHLEFYRSKPEHLFGEIALRPPGGYIMQLLELAYGFDPWVNFVKLELGMPVQFPASGSSAVAGCTVLHPGAGKIISFRSPTAKNFRSLVKSRIKILPGDLITARLSVGEDVGYCLFSADDHQAIYTDIDKMRTLGVFES